MTKLYKIISFLGLLLSVTVANGQDRIRRVNPSTSFWGHPGMIYTPSAYLSNWGDIKVGMTHYPAATAYTFEAGENPERSFFTNLGFLPFGEVTVKITKPYGDLDGKYGIGDRSISFRLQVLKEKEKLPTILIGVQDPFSRSSYFNTNYIVLSKTYELSPIIFSGTLGYGFKIEEARGHILQGIFGGLQAKWQQVRMMIEYDAEHINLGVGYQYRDWISTDFALIDGRNLSANITFHFNIK